MTYHIEFSIYAVETSDAIKEQIRAKWGETVIADFDKRTDRILEIIERTPFAFQAVGSNQNIRRGVIHGNCSMFYEVKGTEIEVLFFWDNRQDPIFLK